MHAPHAPHPLAALLARITLLALLPLLMLAPAACTVGGSSSISKENDRLRAALIENEARLQALTAERDGLLAAVAAGTHSQDLTLEPLIPRVANIEIGQLSGLSPHQRNITPTSALLYFSPLDGKGRFTQLVGSLSATLSLVPQSGQPIVIAQGSLSPTQLHEAYRSGITGTYYQLSMPLTLPLLPQLAAPGPSGTPPRTLLFQITAKDLLTGRDFTAERTITRP